jgi:hypothetical protein
MRILLQKRFQPILFTLLYFFSSYISMNFSELSPQCNNSKLFKKLYRSEKIEILEKYPYGYFERKYIFGILFILLKNQFFVRHMQALVHPSNFECMCGTFFFIQDMKTCNRKHQQFYLMSFFTIHILPLSVRIFVYRSLVRISLWCHCMTKLISMLICFGMHDIHCMFSTYYVTKQFWGT